MALFWTLKRNSSEMTHFCRNFKKKMFKLVSFSLHIHSSLISEAALQYSKKNRWDKESTQDHQVHTWTTESLRIWEKTTHGKNTWGSFNSCTYLLFNSLLRKQKAHKHGDSLTLLDFFGLFITRSKNTLPEEISLRNRSHQK